MSTTGAVNKREAAYHYLKEEILSNQLRPGSFIDEKLYCNKLGVSQTPVREAIQRLRMENLVDYVESKGACVAPLRFEDILCTFELRTVLECHVAAKCTETVRDQDIEELNRLVDRQIKAFDPSTIEHFQFDIAFHSYLAGRANNPMITEAVLSTLERSRRYTTIILPDMSFNSGMDHAKIVEAIASRDPDKACEEMRRHLANTREHNIAKFINHNGFF